MEFADQVRSGGVNGLQCTAAAITWGYPDALMTKRPPRTRAENLQSQGLGRRTPGLRIPPQASAGQRAVLPEGSPSPQQPKGHSAWKPVSDLGCPRAPSNAPRALAPRGQAGKGAALEEGGAESRKERPLTPAPLGTSHSQPLSTCSLSAAPVPPRPLIALELETHLKSLGPRGQVQTVTQGDRPPNTRRPAGLHTVYGQRHWGFVGR